ncbi:uncharacterized protein LOC143043508 [Mytilus galloprovincialis]|uniref:uncharacterized protein LOC143043508 n=1 Tax=Mytilus galloprovincialis TaxID=29158 RepID=UPI003F7BB06E
MKYPCIEFSAGDQPWAHFTARLSQKVRNIRWKWNKKSKRVHSDDGPPTKKKGPRRYDLESDSTEHCTSTETETEAIKIMAEELTKPRHEQNKALILKLQRSTFQQRRKFIQTVEDGNMQSIVEKYPIMKIPEFIVKEFEMMKPDLKKDVLLERWTDVLGILDKMFEGNDQDSDNEENLNTDQELIKIIDRIEAKIKFRTSKKEQNDLIAKVDVKNVDLSTKKKSPPRAIILTNQDGSINNTYMVGDGLQISTGTDIKQLLQLLVVTYYVYDLSYPKCYQLLGFLQMAILKDNANFHKGANYLKFEKEFLQHVVSREEVDN